MVGLAQLHELGLTTSGVQKRVVAGRLHRLHREVYAVGHSRTTREGHWMAAVLACGEGAVLSHRSAAALWGLRSSSITLVDVIAPERTGRSRPGIAVHRAGRMIAVDRVDWRGIPCTSVARTLVDLSDVLGRRALAHAVEQAERSRRFDLRAVDEVLTRAEGRRGIPRLRAALERYDPRAELTRSELERRVLELCDAHDLPRPRVNQPIGLPGGPITVDFAWPSQRLVLEADGYETHGTRAGFEADRRRDQRLRLAGWSPVRTTWCQVAMRPLELAQALRVLLAA